MRSVTLAREIADKGTAETVDNMIALAHVMLQRRSRSRGSREAKIVQGVISRRQLSWYVWLSFRVAQQVDARSAIWLDRLHGLRDDMAGLVLPVSNRC